MGLGLFHDGTPVRAPRALELETTRAHTIAGRSRREVSTMIRQAALVLPAVLLAFATAHARPGNLPKLDPLKQTMPDAEVDDGDEETGADVSLRIEVRAKYKDLSGEVDFVMMNQTQANHVVGGDRAFKVETENGTGLEFKRWGFIVNALPVIDPNRPHIVDTQLQIELSGPIRGREAVEVETWQIQTEALATLGKWKTLARKPAEVSIRITRDD
jgi:hypothetical protein